MVETVNLSSDKEIIEAYQKFDLPNDIMEDLFVFLEARTVYMNKQDLDSRVELKRSFDNIYHNTKYAFHVKLMTEQDFLKLTNLLRKGI